MVLFPLEFSDCLTDSPSFRQKIQEHEKELARTNQSIKRLIKQLRDMITAARCLAKAQETLASTLLTFKFECIGPKQTDDEQVINRSLFEFGSMMSALEKEHSQMLDQAELKFLQDLDEFRKKRFGSVKEGKKNFDRETAKFCTSLEKHLGLPAKKNESTLKEADADIDVQLKNFQKASLDYVLLLQEVQEQKKFEFVEILLGFLYSWISFYHQGYEVYQDYEPYVKLLQAKIQKCRDEFESMKEEGQSLKEKVLEVRKRTRNDPSAKNKDGRDGYLFLLEKSKMAALKALGTTWVKYYCYYKKTTRELRIVCFSQTNSAAKLPTELMHRVESCQRRSSDTIDKRFCFDVKTTDKQTLTFQALSEEDRCLWIDTMDGKEMLYDLVGLPKRPEQENLLNDVGAEFVRACIDAIEKRGINEQGIYRVVGVVSKVSKLTSICLDRRNAEKVLKELSDQNSEWEVRTITSALKSYFKNLPEPLLTFQLHQEFITASKKESKTLRINDIHSLVYKLPESHLEMLGILIRHLNNVASHSQHNLMTVANLGVCFGPTLMRDEEESMASIIDIKFCNVVVEILIEYYDKIFHSKPDGTNILEDEVPKSPLAMRTNPLAPPQICPEPEVKPREEVDDPIPYARSLRLQLIEANQRKLRPRAIYESEELVEGLSKPPRAEAVSSSSSSSNDSLSSRSQSSSNPASFPLSSDARGRDNVRAAVANPFYGVPGEVYRPEDTSRSRHYDARGAPNSNSSGSNSSQQHFPKLGPPMPPMPPDLLARSIAAANSGPHGAGLNPAPKRRARALYACTGDNDQELSFECGATIEHVRPSREPGWLIGVINARTGLIPANYVEFLPH